MLNLITVLCNYVGSADFEKRYSSSNRAHDVSSVHLPELQESIGVPDHSSVFQYDEDDDDDVATEGGDSKEEVLYVHHLHHYKTIDLSL